ncbi:MAG: NUDIX hydrolase [Flavobacteriaceae bacterium]|nr:MAG: NUDIX hydrolase [Flavobacteriaceae bacterium]
MKKPMNAKELVQLFKKSEHLFLPNISVDSVIFGYEQGQLQVLLLQVDENTWMLPGGYVYKTESVDEAAHRNIYERIALKNTFLKQYAVFGGVDRDFKLKLKNMFQQFGHDGSEELWIQQRFVSIGYYALVDKAKTYPKPNLFAKACAWHNVYELPKLLLDHKKIILKALASFRTDLEHNPIGYHLLSTKFTMPELHQVFESVHDKQMDRSRFQKKMFGYAVFERLERKEGVAHRRPYYYRHGK